MLEALRPFEETGDPSRCKNPTPQRNWPRLVVLARTDASSCVCVCVFFGGQRFGWWRGAGSFPPTPP